MSRCADAGRLPSQTRKYENKDDFLLKPGSVSTEFELFNEKDESVKITISNDSKKAAKIEDCSVYYLRVKTADVHTVLPGGFNESTEL